MACLHLNLGGLGLECWVVRPTLYPPKQGFKCLLSISTRKSGGRVSMCGNVENINYKLEESRITLRCLLNVTIFTIEVSCLE